MELSRELLEACKGKPVWLGCLRGFLCSLGWWLCRKVGQLSLCRMRFFWSPCAPE